MATAQNDNLITAVVPAGTTTGLVTVDTTVGSAVSTFPFIVLLPPRITSFSPAVGVEGTQVRVEGVGFVRATAVGFNGLLSAAFSVSSDSSLTATVPRLATTGPISVTNPLGTAVSAQSFLIARPPSIGTFAPTSGPAGTEVTITGANLLTTTAVTFDGASAPFTVTNDTTVRATVPDNGSSGRIRVVNPAGNATSNMDFTVVRLPKINSFTPTSGPVGTPVTIMGRNFATASLLRFRANNVTGRVNAQFAVGPNDPATGMAVINTTVPAGAITGKIRIVNAAGGVKSDTRFTVTP
jgi:hypothetical protein